jgi:hypothetical protein
MASATTVHFETVRACDYDMWRKFDLDVHVYICIFILDYMLHFCELEMICEVTFL